MSTPETQTRARRKERRGVVVSDAMEKTVVVRVDVVKPHPKYKKMLRRSIRLHASRKTVLFNGALECRLYEYRMVEGGNRPRASAAGGAGS